MFAAQERAVEVDRDHSRKGLAIGLVDRAAHEHARRVDQTGEVARRSGEPLDHGLPVALAGHVDDVVDVLAMLEVTADYHAAGIPDRPADGRSDGAGRAGDEDGTVGQAHHAFRARMAACCDAGPGRPSPIWWSRSSSASAGGATAIAPDARAPNLRWSR